METEKVVDYLENPHSEPFVLYDLVYGEGDIRTVGDIHLDYENRTFGEIKSQLQDLEDIGVVEIDKSRTQDMAVGTVYRLTDVAQGFFYEGNKVSTPHIVQTEY